MSEDNNIEEGLADAGAKVLGGIYRTVKNKVTTPKMQVTTPAGKTYNMPRGATSTEVGAPVSKGSGLKPVGLGTAAAAGTAVGAGVYAVQTAKNEPAGSTPTKLPDIDVPAKKTETPKTSTAAEPKKPMSFSQTFKAAREKATTAGSPSTGQFEFQGKKYQTNVAGEKYVPTSKQTKVDTGSTPEVPLPPKRPADLNTETPKTKPESESGGKKKMSEDTNPLIAAFLKLQSENPQNMFEAAKKAKKDHDGDGKIESEKDEVWGSRFKAARAAGKMEEATLKDPKDPSVQGSGDVTMSAPKPAAPAAAPVHVKPTNPEKLKNLKDPRDPSVQGSGDVTYKEEVEEVEFSQAEIDHINSFFLEASVAPNRPEVATGADSTSDKMSQNDVTGTAESGKRIRKEEIELEEGFAKIVKGIKRSLKGWPAEPLHGSGGNKPKDVVKRTRERSDSDVKSLASDSNKAAEHSPAGLQKNVAKQEMKRRNLEEGRPKKNPEPETTERDPRKHIQVEAGRAAAGNVVDFTHNDGSKSKITPAMGRRITSHLNTLKPADRQAAVNRMHASPEGLKV